MKGPSLCWKWRDQSKKNGGGEEKKKKKPRLPLKEEGFKKNWPKDGGANRAPAGTRKKEGHKPGQFLSPQRGDNQTRLSTPFVERRIWT